jgi:hypothetical protein
MTNYGRNTLEIHPQRQWDWALRDSNIILCKAPVTLAPMTSLVRPLT